MIVLIGGSGFIGTRLAQRLEQAAIPFVIIDKQTGAAFPDRTLTADVRDPASLRAASQQIAGSPGTIVNLAAEHRDDVRPRSLYDEVNVQGAGHVCDLARATGVTRLVFTSSVAVYGFAPPDSDESAPPNYFNEYGRTKWEAEQVYRRWQSEDPDTRSLVIVRPTVVFGEGNRGNVYNLLSAISRRRFLIVGSGKNRKSMAYVENVAAFLQFSLSAFGPGVHVYNYVDKPDYDTETLVRTVREMLGQRDGILPKVPYVFAWSGGLAFDMLAGITGRQYTVSRVRARKLVETTQFACSVHDTGFAPPVSLGEGLEKTIQNEIRAEGV